MYRYLARLLALPYVVGRVQGNHDIFIELRCYNKIQSQLLASNLSVQMKDKLVVMEVKQMLTYLKCSANNAGNVLHTC